MTHKNETIQQEPLFHSDELEYRRGSEFVDGHEIPVTYGLIGSYVDTKERAQYLISALDAISQRNIREGISVAAYTKQYSAPIWDRYQEVTQDVLDGASRNRNIYHQQLRESFWHATGFAALRGMGLIPERQINPRAQKMWRDFNAAYGHPKNLKERNKYKKSLQSQIDGNLDEQLRLVA